MKYLQICSLKEMKIILTSNIKTRLSLLLLILVDLIINANTGQIYRVYILF